MSAPTGREVQTAAMPLPRLLLSVEEAAEALSVGRTVMYSLVGSGEMPSIRIGRRTLVPVIALEAYVARRTNEAIERSAIGSKVSDR